MKTVGDVNQDVLEAKAAIAQRLQRMAEESDFIAADEMNALANAFAALTGSPVVRSGTVY